MMFAQSLRWRMQFWLMLVLVAILFGFGWSVYQLHHTNQLQRLDAELERNLGPLHFATRVSGRSADRNKRRRSGDSEPRESRWEPADREPQGQSSDLRRSGTGPDFTGKSRAEILNEILLGPRASPFFGEDDIEGYFFAVWDEEGDLLATSGNAPQWLTKPGQTAKGGAVTIITQSNSRLASQYTGRDEALLVGRSLASVADSQRTFLAQLLLMGAAVLLIGVGGGWWITNRAIKPIEQISEAAKRISAGNLDERIETGSNQNEIGRLAEVLNTTFARLETAFEQQRRFVADAAHELRTPLAVLITEAQSSLNRERSAEDYRESLEYVLESAQQMRGLIESLLELARYESDQNHDEPLLLDFVELTQSCISQLQSIADQRTIDLRWQTELIECPVVGKENQLRSVVTNLLANAIYYNHVGGWVTLSLEASASELILTMKNTGPGIEATDIPHVFDRFYRADKARSRADGKSGLGLAISKAIVDAHSGRIKVQSANGLTQFTVYLPIASS